MALGFYLFYLDRCVIWRGAPMRIFTVILLIVTTFSAQAELKRVGKLKNSTRLEDGVIGAFDSELFKHTTLKNRLFKDLDLDLEYEINDHLGVQARFGRRVHIFNPILDSDIISHDDYSKFYIVNSSREKLSGSLDLFNLPVSAGIEAGMELAVARSVYPATSKMIQKADKAPKEICRDLQKALKSKQLNRFVCENTNVVKNFFSSIVTGVGKIVSFLASPFVDSEQGEIYFSDPLEALKIHMKFGVPINDKVFYEENGYLLEGDIIKHTTFFSIDPLRMSYDLVGIISPEYKRFNRFIRDLSIKKLEENKVAVVIEDFVYRGNDITYAKFRPRLLSLFKYSFLSWGYETLSEEVLRKTYFLDLNKENAREALSSFITKGFYLDFNPSITDKAQELGDGIIMDPVLHYQGDVTDYSYNSKFPGIFKVVKEDVSRYRKIRVDGKKSYINSEKYIHEKFSLKNFLWFDDIKKAGICSINVNSNYGENDQKKSFFLYPQDLIVQIACSYQNAFAKNKDINKIISTIDFIIGNKLTEQKRNEISLIVKDSGEKEVDVSAKVEVNFGYDQAKAIIEETSIERIWEELAVLILGKENRHEWGKDNRKKWNESIISENRAWHNPHISKKFNCRSDSDGEFKKGKIVFKVAGNCHILYRHSKKIMRNIKKLKESTNSRDRLSNFSKLFFDLESGPLLQRLIINLLNGVDKSKVGYKYEVYSSGLSTPISGSSENQYTFSNKAHERKVENVKALKNSRRRIKKANFYVDTAKGKFSERTHAEIELELTHRLDMKNSKFFAAIKLGKFSILKDKELYNSYTENEMLPIGNLKQIVRKYGKENRYLYRFSAPILSSKVKKGKRYSLFVNIVNEKGEWVTESAEVLVKMPRR